MNVILPSLHCFFKVVVNREADALARLEAGSMFPVNVECGSDTVADRYEVRLCARESGHELS